jgi:hypothetical protein
MRTNDHILIPGHAPGHIVAPDLPEPRLPEPLDVADLPDDLAELALQLDSDADRLSGLYPARLPAGDDERAQPAAPQRPLRRPAWRVGTLSRVAAAVLILGGLTLAISGHSMWRGRFGSPLDGSLGAPSLATAPRPQGPDGAAAGAGSVQPVFISTEAMRQFSGEETEILADAIPHSSAVVIADL